MLIIIFILKLIIVLCDYFQTLPTYATPELCRTPLCQTVLKTKILNMGEPHALLSLALDPPNLSDIHRTILTLKQARLTDILFFIL